MGKYNQFHRTAYGTGFNTNNLHIKKINSNPLNAYTDDLQIKAQQSQPQRKSNLEQIPEAFDDSRPFTDNFLPKALQTSFKFNP